MQPPSIRILHPNRAPTLVSKRRNLHPVRNHQNNFRTASKPVLSSLWYLSEAGYDVVTVDTATDLAEASSQLKAVGTKRFIQFSQHCLRCAGCSNRV